MLIVMCLVLTEIRWWWWLSNFLFEKYFVGELISFNAHFLNGVFTKSFNWRYGLRTLDDRAQHIKFSLSHVYVDSHLFMLLIETQNTSNLQYDCD